MSIVEDFLTNTEEQEVIEAIRIAEKKYFRRNQSSYRTPYRFKY